MYIKKCDVLNRVAIFENKLRCFAPGYLKGYSYSGRKSISKPKGVLGIPSGKCIYNDKYFDTSHMRHC